MHNQSNDAFKKANTADKKIDRSAAFLSKQENTVNSIADAHKDRRIRKANNYIQSSNNFAQKANKAAQLGMSMANIAKSNITCTYLHRTQ